MKTGENAAKQQFYKKLKGHINNGEELSIKKIYSIFSEMNPKTVSWNLYHLVQQGKLYRTGHGLYALTQVNENNSIGYYYLQQKSQKIYDIVIDYGYEFYITGMDSLIGELLHMPEQYPVLLVTEDAGITEIQDVLSQRNLIVVKENSRDILKDNTLRSKIDVIILKGKDFSLSFEHIAQKEKGFVDLYYAVTRLDYGVSIQELSRAYQSMKRNKSHAMAKLKSAARDRGISTEINWLMEINKAPKKALEFMSYQIKEEI